MPCAAMLAGCDGLLAIPEWGRDSAGGAPLAGRLGGTRTKTPGVATLHRVCKVLEAVTLERAVGAWGPGWSPRRPRLRDTLTLLGQSER